MDTSPISESCEIIPEEKWIIKKGTKINRLTLEGPVFYFRHKTQRKQRGLFTCECGNSKETDLGNVKSGSVKSCGCLLIETRKEMGRKYGGRNQTGTNAIDGKKKCANPACAFKDIEQSIEQFYYDSKAKDGYRCYCKNCCKIKVYESVYGRKFSEFEKQLSIQNYVCDFCGRQFDDTADHMFRAAQDHDHKTNKNRGVLHCKCNIMIGNIEQYPSYFPRSQFPMVDDYLKKWEQIHRGEEQECLANAV